MSTSFYFVCDKCRIGIKVAQTHPLGLIFYHGEDECMSLLREFLEDHAYHDIRFIDEDKFFELIDEDMQDKYTELNWRH